MLHMLSLLLTRGAEIVVCTHQALVAHAIDFRVAAVADYVDVVWASGFLLGSRLGTLLLHCLFLSLFVVGGRRSRGLARQWAENRLRTTRRLLSLWK
jgi:hypothetical protein